MRIIEIYSGLIWSACYEGEKKDIFSKLFRRWIDLEELTAFFTTNQRFLRNNVFFDGYTLKEVILNAYKEATSFRTDFTRYYFNQRNGKHPDLDDRFTLLNRRTGRDDSRREMYGHPPDMKKMTSVFRLYAIKIPSADEGGSAAYIITGGGIKLTDSMQEMKELNRELLKFELVQQWLERNSISTKEQLIDYQSKNAEHTNDRMGEAGSNN